MTQARLAEELEVSTGLVSRYRHEGMPIGSVSAARAWIRANKRARAKASGVSEREEGSPPDYLTARAAREAAEAELAQLKVLEARGELANMKEVRGQLARRLSGLKDSLLQIPSRLQSVVAGETNEAKCHDMIQDELLQVLGQFSELLT